MLKQMNEEQLIQCTGGRWWSPCDSWWGCSAFGAAVGLAAGLVSGGVAGMAGMVLGTGACIIACS